jgi:hypothetical protein
MLDQGLGSGCSDEDGAVVCRIFDPEVRSAEEVGNAERGTRQVAIVVHDPPVTGDADGVYGDETGCCAPFLIGAVRKGRKKSWRVALGTARVVAMKVP